jgi:hypothetical protein
MKGQGLDVEVLQQKRTHRREAAQRKGGASTRSGVKRSERGTS